MTPSQASAVIVELVDNLRKRGSWCGETHIQKAAYFLEEAFEVPLGFEFVLYKYGPYSFELSDHISRMRSRGLLKLVPRPYPYGPSMELDAGAGALKTMFPKTVEKYLPQIAQVAQLVDSRGASDLEKLSTAFLVTKELGQDATIDDRAAVLVEYKPHVDLESAASAVAEVDRLFYAR